MRKGRVGGGYGIGVGDLTKGRRERGREEEGGGQIGERLMCLAGEGKFGIGLGWGLALVGVREGREGKGRGKGKGKGNQRILDLDWTGRGSPQTR